jgi:hypothetical protein
MPNSLTDIQRANIERQILTAQDWLTLREELIDLDKGKFNSRSERNRALVRGSYWHVLNRINNTKVLSINHIAPALQVKATVVSGGETAFICDSTSQRFDPIEKIAKRFLTFCWKMLDFDGSCDAAYWDSRIYPEGGVVELGWRYKDDQLESVSGRPGEAEIGEADLKANNPELMPMVTAPPPGGFELGISDEMFDNLAETAVWDNEPLIDDPFIERFSPLDLLIDPACTSYTLKGARYVFRRKKVLLSDVKKVKRYTNTGELVGASYSTTASLDEKPTAAIDVKQQDSVDDESMWVTLYDGYTYVDDELKHVVFCDENKKELLLEDPPYADFNGDNVFPFEIMPPFIPDNDTLDGVPDVEQVRDLQVSHDLAFTQAEFQRAHSPNVLMVPEGTFGGANGERTKKRIEEGQENAVLEINPSYIASVKWLERPQIRQEAYEVLESTPRKILDKLGINEYQSNMLPEKQMTATEAGQLSTQGGTRQDREIEAYYDFIRRCAIKVLVLYQAFLVREREYSFDDEQGEKQYGMVSRETLRGVVPGSADENSNPLGDLENPGIQFVIDIDVSKKQPKNEFSERKNLVDLLGVLTPFVQMGLNIKPILDKIMQSFDIVNENEIMPMAQPMMPGMQPGMNPAMMQGQPQQ